MKQRQIQIFLFIDALGWKIAEDHHFLADLLPHRHPVRTQFGYSSTAVPTILSGKSPVEHRHFSFFYYDRDRRSPFRFLRFWQPLLRPRRLFDHHRVRHRLSQWLKKYFGFTGYFQLYRVPFERLPYLDYCEKQDIFAPGGLAPVRNLHDELLDSELSFHLSDWRQNEWTNLRTAVELVRRGACDFYFLYTAGLDGMLHFHVGDDQAVAAYLADYRRRIEALLAAAQERGEECVFTVISDHGMTALTGSCDLRARIEALKLRFGVDYVVCYDSTMLRLWILKPECRSSLLNAVDGAPGHWLTAAEKRDFGIDFPDAQYGEEIFLLDPGVQLVPGDMGARTIPGMHGYHPDDPDSTACLLSNRPVAPPASIAGFFDLMTAGIRRLREAK